MANLQTLPKEGFIDKDGRTWMYGAWWMPQRMMSGSNALTPRPQWSIEREMYWNSTPDGGMWKGGKEPEGHLGRKEHYMRMVTLIWGREDSIWPFEWNPNAERMLEAKLRERVLLIGGHGGSGKSEFLALWGVTNFLFKPFDTKVIATSITMKSSEGKIWGSISECWGQAGRGIASYIGQEPTRGESLLPGKLLSHGIIRYESGGVETTKAGMELVPGDASKSKESSGKVQGYHRERIFVLLDELATLDHGLVNTVESNLMTNSGTDVTAAFNPDSHFDPAGKMCEPEPGWNSVSISDLEWRAKNGAYVIRFDGICSPNVVAGYKKWRGLLPKEEYDKAESNGAQKKSFFQMFRGWWSPTGSLDCIYSEDELEKWLCLGDYKNLWIEKPTPCGFIDPSFAEGGDRAMACAGFKGKVSLNGAIVEVLEVSEVRQLDLDLAKGDKPVLLAHAYMEWCKEKGILPKYAGYDATGSQFGSILASIWSPEVVAVSFNKSPSDKPVTRTEGPAKDHYQRKVDEIWYAPKPLMRGGQIRGLKPEIVVELTSRTYTTVNGKIKVEPKEDMKKRTLRSPDCGDAFCGLVDVARMKMGLAPTERPKRDRDASGRSLKAVQMYRELAGVVTSGIERSGGGELYG